eukprot:6610964-Prymnesium_polylepis.1
MTLGVVSRGGCFEGCHVGVARQVSGPHPVPKSRLHSTHRRAQRQGQSEGLSAELRDEARELR